VKPRPPVLPGEIYRDNDGRQGSHGTRYVQVVVVDGERAHVQRVKKDGSGWVHEAQFPSTRIRLAAFHSRAQTGFTLIDTPWPAQRLTVEVTGGTDLIIQRLIYAIESEAHEFQSEFASIAITADGSKVLDITGKRRLLEDVLADE
jgi:hypothetical protein